MAFKNPANISTLDDETCSKIALQGIYYSDARTRYPDMVAVVRCDKCGLCPLSCSIGFESYDLCLPCVNTIRSDNLPVKELELDLTVRTEALQSEEGEDDINIGTDEPNDSILSIIKHGAVRAIYNYLNKFAGSEPETFKLTADEADKLAEYCDVFLGTYLLKTINL